MSSFRSGISGLTLFSQPSVPGPRRPASVYGGSGAKGVRVSYASSLGSGFDLADAYGGDSNSSFNGKITMQNLNDRLASYLDKVRMLEGANQQLELQIRQWYAQQTPTVRDYSRYEAIIDDLRKKISDASQNNARLMLQIDNAKLAAEDFRIKFENELALRMSVEADIAGLRKVLDDLTLARSDLEMQVEGLKEELAFMKKNHEEELTAMRNQVNSSSVNVEVDAKPQDDLSRTMEDIRTQYEGITEKNRREMEAWYKFDELNKEVVSATETLQTSRTEISELKRTLQALQIELQSQLSLKSAMEGTLAETESHYNQQLTQLQDMVNTLQNELSQVKADIERQGADYRMLLDIKTRLEMEIAEYRRLLDGEDHKKTVVTSTNINRSMNTNMQRGQVKEIEEEKRQPVKSVRKKVLIEEIVDGKVVSLTEHLEPEVFIK
uniref:keratin, type I cytoskeletal 19-like isoform X1 n=1 Tax=Monopterus albus TaxID=43700 RepID=UPI0009B4EB1E|nr:keratin, type I cytoskeletal 19-like isoform X1 [Monopterus albus]